MGKYYTLDSSKFKYTCETCGKKIKSPQNLEVHRKMHKRAQDNTTNTNDYKDVQVKDAKNGQVGQENVQHTQTTENSFKYNYTCANCGKNLIYKQKKCGGCGINLIWD